MKNDNISEILTQEKINELAQNDFEKLIESYESEGSFTKQKSDKFLAIYNANKDGFDTAGAEYAELNYKIGMMYFNYYSGDDSSAGFSDRVQKAYPFFAANMNRGEGVENFQQEKLSNCYYQICSFYKKYILNSATVEEASRENYEELFATIRSALNDVSDAGAYDQLSMYNGVFMLIYDQRHSMASVNVEYDEVSTLLKDVYDGAKKLTVQKEQSKRLQQEIDNYLSYSEAVSRAYTNAEEDS